MPALLNAMSSRPCVATTRVEEIPYRRFIGDVDRDELAADLGGRGGTRLRRHIDHDDRRTLVAESSRGGQADPARAAGDHRDPTLQTLRHVSLHTLSRSRCQSLARNTFLTSVNACSASGPSSRPRPDCFMPPNGVQ